METYKATIRHKTTGIEFDLYKPLQVKKYCESIKNYLLIKESTPHFHIHGVAIFSEVTQSDIDNFIEMGGELTMHASEFNTEALLTDEGVEIFKKNKKNKSK